MDSKKLCLYCFILFKQKQIQAKTFLENYFITHQSVVKYSHELLTHRAYILRFFEHGLHSNCFELTSNMYLKTMNRFKDEIKNCRLG